MSVLCDVDAALLAVAHDAASEKVVDVTLPVRQSRGDSFMPYRALRRPAGVISLRILDVDLLAAGAKGHASIEEGVHCICL